MEQRFERRKQRSTDPIVALHYQLAAVRDAASLDAVVLVDESGCLVAGAGAWPLCEELAAFAPLLADQSAIQSPDVASQAARLAALAHVRPMSVDGLEVVLCARGGNANEVIAEMSRAASGCARILTAGP